MEKRVFALLSAFLIVLASFCAACAEETEVPEGDISWDQSYEPPRPVNVALDPEAMKRTGLLIRPLAGSAPAGALAEALPNKCFHDGIFEITRFTTSAIWGRSKFRRSFRTATPTHSAAHVGCHWATMIFPIPVVTPGRRSNSTNKVLRIVDAHATAVWGEIENGSNTYWGYRRYRYVCSGFCFRSRAIPTAA